MIFRLHYTNTNVCLFLTVIGLLHQSDQFFVLFQHSTFKYVLDRNQLQFKSTNQKVFHAKVRSKVQQYFMFQFTKCVEVSAIISFIRCTCNLIYSMKQTPASDGVNEEHYALKRQFTQK